LVIYAEGGDKGMLAAEARQAFSKFLHRCFASVRPKVIFCGGRDQAFRQYDLAKKAGEDCLLLVDSEEIALSNVDPWKQDRIVLKDKWKPPANSDADLHFMAATMETWITACASELAAYFGQGFRLASLPARENLEDEPKKDLNSKLQAATKRSKTKGPYDKGKHSFDLVAGMNPDSILKRCPFWAQRFCDELRRRGMR